MKATLFLVGIVMVTLTACQSTPLKARAPAEEPGYCIALRGNGQLEPAHWGALAKTIEQLGLPSAISGGSSATISMFLLEAIAEHPLLQGQTSDLQKERASFLIKSLMAFVAELQKTKSWADFRALYQGYQVTKSLPSLNQVQQLLTGGNADEASTVLHEAIGTGLLDTHSIWPILSAIQHQQIPKAQFLVQQLQETIQVFGQFNAATDDNLFFRAGLVDFEKLAMSFGKIASFYAAAANNPQTQNWQSFFDSCAVNSKGLSWTEIVQKNPSCQASFHQLFQTHFSVANQPAHLEKRIIGKIIRAYPTVAVLRNSAATHFRQAMSEYQSSMDPHFGKSFQFTDAETDEIRFGYWGSDDSLTKISQSLDRTDEKNKRFLALGPATWEQVLSLSPAEPGLSPLKEFQAEGKTYFAAGGWSDLHPVAVLRAAGCQDVVYLTRQGGESLFAEGVAKRFLNLSRDWSLLQTAGPATDADAALNDAGDPTDQTTLWSKLFNLGNPQSSLNRSLANSSAILCTNWNAFEVQKDFLPLVQDSYASSFWLNPGKKSALISDLQPVLAKTISGCQPISQSHGAE